MSRIREALIELADCAFRREAPFEIIGHLSMPSMMVRERVYFDEDVARELNVLGHRMYTQSLRENKSPEMFPPIEARIRELEGQRSTTSAEAPLRIPLPAERAECMDVLRRFKRELGSRGWKRSVGGRFTKDLQGFWILIWFDPGTWAAFMSPFLAVGPGPIRLEPGRQFDIVQEMLFSYQDARAFERNLRNYMLLIDTLAAGLEARCRNE